MVTPAQLAGDVVFVLLLWWGGNRFCRAVLAASGAHAAPDAAGTTPEDEARALAAGRAIGILERSVGLPPEPGDHARATIRRPCGVDPFAMMVRWRTDATTGGLSREAPGAPGPPASRPTRRQGSGSTRFRGRR